MKTIIIKNITIIIIIFIQIISAHEREMMMQVVDNNGNPIVLTVELYELDNLFEPYRSGRSESYWKWVSPSSANVAADHGGDLIPDPTFPLVEPGNYRLRIDNKYTLLTINTEYNGDGDYIIKFQNNQFSIVMNNRGVSISETNDWDIPITVKNFVNSSETGRIQVNGVDIQTNTEIYLKTTTSHDFYAPDVYTGSDFRNWNNIIQNNIYQRLTHNNTLSDDMAYEIISSHHEPTHPLTVHNYLEGGSGGIINIAWLPNGSQVKDDDISSGEFYNAFDATDLPDRYNVSINQTILGQYGTNWEFQYWDDGSTSLTRGNIAVSEPTTLKAYYKGVDKTDAATALTNNNQAKIIRIGTSSNGTLFKVYESMDCVWLEKSTNNGVSWELMNDAHPLNDISNGVYGCSPDIKLDNDNVFNFYVVLQEYEIIPGEIQNNIRLLYYDASQSEITRNELMPGSSYYVSTGSLSKMNPVIAKNNLDRAVIVFKISSNFESGSHTPGLYYYYLKHRSYYSSFNWVNSGGEPIYINNSSSSSSNPSIAISWVSSGEPFHLVWQEGISTIKYCPLSHSSSSISQGTVSDISSGSGFTANRNPSIAMKDNYPAVSWYASNTGLFEQDRGVSQVVNKTISRIKFSSGWSNFVQNGNDVVSHHLASSRDGNVILIWNEYVNGVYTSKIAENLLVIPQSYNSINSKVVTANHSAALDGITAFGLNSQGSLPYNFSITDLDISHPSKITSSIISEGRSGVVYKDTTEYFFALGDIFLDGNKIEYEEFPDSLIIDTKSLLNKYVSTQSFELNEGSSLTYSVYFGLTDSAGTA